MERLVDCPDCGGTGIVNGTGCDPGVQECYFCDGRGEVPELRATELEFQRILQRMASIVSPAWMGVDEHLEAQVRVARAMGTLPDWARLALVEAFRRGNG